MKALSKSTQKISEPYDADRSHSLYEYLYMYSSVA